MGFVVRYLSPDTANHPQKRLTADEVRGLRETGLWIGSVWEEMGNLGEMNAETGAAHANDALAVAGGLGQPQGSALYFCVDFDAVGSEVAAVQNYFAAVHPILDAAGYLVGGYGSGSVCAHILEMGLCHRAWLSCSIGWTGSEGYDGWTIRQSDGQAVAGFSADEVDFNELSADASANPSLAGLWP